MAELPICVALEIHAPVARVWQAITLPEQMRQWFFAEIPAFEARKGFETQFTVQAESRDFLHRWQIVEVIPEQVIRYRWLYPDYPGESLVSFRLSPKGKDTLLEITHQGMQSYPQEVPEFSRESCQGGWEYFGKRVKDWLEG